MIPKIDVQPKNKTIYYFQIEILTATKSLTSFKKRKKRENSGKTKTHTSEDDDASYTKLPVSVETKLPSSFITGNPPPVNP